MARSWHLITSIWSGAPATYRGNGKAGSSVLQNDEPIPPKICVSAVNVNGALAPVQQPSVSVAGLARFTFTGAGSDEVSALRAVSHASICRNTWVDTNVPRAPPLPPVQMTWLSALPLAFFSRSRIE